MARAKYQVLVIPYYIENDTVKYGIFHRRNVDAWQFIAGGGEDEDVFELVSAKREAYEEAGIDMTSKYSALDTISSISTSCFSKARKVWGEECLVNPEYSFVVNLDRTTLELSHEHIEYEWVGYEIANKRLQYDSNKTALWELDNKIKLGLIK